MCHRLVCTLTRCVGQVQFWLQISSGLISCSKSLNFSAALKSRLEGNFSGANHFTKANVKVTVPLPQLCMKPRLSEISSGPSLAAVMMYLGRQAHIPVPTLMPEHDYEARISQESEIVRQYQWSSLCHSLITYGLSRWNVTWTNWLTRSVSIEG